MPDIPILGRKTGANGQPVRPLAQKYVGEVRTLDGDAHRMTFDLGLPQDANGIADLGALEDLDPARQFYANIGEMIARSRIEPRIVFAQVDGGHIVIGAITSCHYLGTLEEVEAADRERPGLFGQAL